MRPHIHRAAASAIWILLPAYLALTTANAQRSDSLPPVRQLGRRLAISSDTFGTVFNISQLSDGRVIVNDSRAHQLVLLDSALSHPVVIADSTPATNKVYGTSIGGLVPYRADTTLFIDPIALSLIVLDPSGHTVRVIAPPLPDDAGALVDPRGGAAFDARGRIIYCATGARFFANRDFYSVGSACLDPTPSPNAPPPAPLTAAPSYAIHDSIPIGAGDIPRHALDTVGFIAVPIRTRATFADAPDGSQIRTLPETPIELDDDWAVMSDGSVAFVRALDYHIDWVNADGSRSSSPPIAHAWHRLTDDEKTAILDSIRHRIDSAASVGLIADAKQDSLDRAHHVTPQPKMHTVHLFPAIADMPDYIPPFRASRDRAARADADDELWIREGYQLPSPTSPPAIYDIVNRQGRLVDRVQIPRSLILAAFGPGVVYLTSREGAGTVIVKYRIR